MRILGIDPGGTTGLYLASVEEVNRTCMADSYESVTTTFRGIRKEETKNQDLLFDYLGNGFTGWCPDVVVLENFRLRLDGARNEGQMVVELIGVIKYICKLHKIELVLQEPSDKVFVQKRLKEFNKQLRGHWGDSCNHCARYAFLHLGCREFVLDGKTYKA